MTKTVEFHFDVGSPNAYLSHVLIPGIEQRTGVTITYVPVLLGGIFKATGNISPAEAAQGVRNKRAYIMLEMDRFVQRHGISRFGWNPHFPINALLLMRGAVAARMDGLLAPYVDAVFRAIWEDGASMGDREVAETALSAAGLPAERLLARAGDADVKQALLDSTNRSVEMGAFGSPNMFVDGAMYFGKDRLAEAEEAIRA